MQVISRDERETADPRPPAPGVFRLAELRHECLPIGKLAVRLKDLGYTIERGEFGQPESRIHERVHGGNSLRPEQVKDTYAPAGLTDGSGADRRAPDADSQGTETPEEVLRQHRELAASTATKPIEWFAEARSRSSNTPTVRQSRPGVRDLCPRSPLRAFGVESERSIMTAALSRSMGEANFAQVGRSSTGESRQRVSRPEPEFQAAWTETQGPAVHDRGHAAHGARDHRPECRKATDAGTAIRCWLRKSSHRDRGPAPGIETRTAPGRR